MRLHVILFCLFLPNSLSQRRYDTNRYPRTCQARPGLSNCYAPSACRTGHYENTEGFIRQAISFCCYSDLSQYRGLNEWSLDCRKRIRTNLAITDTSLNVVELDLSFNNFANYVTQLRDDFIKHFKNLKSLRIEISRLDTLPADLLSAHAQLERVVFAWNDITELPEDLFANNSKLFEVNLRDNEITYIPDGLFRNNPKMRSLQISGNSLTRLSQASLRHLPQLTTFDASHNEGMKCMSADLFRYNTKLLFVRMNDLGPFIPKNIQRFYCDGGFCPYTMRKLKYIMRTYQYLYQCADEGVGRPNPLNTYRSYRRNF